MPFASWFLMALVAGLLAVTAHAQDTPPPAGGKDQKPDEPPIVSAGRFAKVYDPGIGEVTQWYINDHCFIRGEDGTWHLYGITRQEPASPMDEDHFAHATARSLMQLPWQKQPYALDVAPELGEVHLWAPHVVRHNGLYYMYYCAGGKSNAQYEIRLATSRDLKSWTRHPKNPMVVDGYDARDPMVMQVGDKWVMYYTATSEPAGGNHTVAYATSDDLVSWTRRGVVYTDPAKGTFGGPTESPFVVRRGRYWYLFVGPRPDYNGTDVFRSEDPFHWDIANKVGHIPSHAAEVIRDADGKWYVSRAGWAQGGVYIAPLIWNDGQDENDTSMPPPASRQPRSGK